MKKEFNLPAIKISSFSRASILTTSAVSGTENADYSTMQSFNTQLQTKIDTDKGSINKSTLSLYDIGSHQQ